MTKHFVFEILDSKILPLWRFECFALPFEVLSSTLKMQRYQVLCLKRAAKNLSSSQGISTNHPKQASHKTCIKQQSDSPERRLTFYEIEEMLQT